MTQSLAKIYLHVVFSTKERIPYIIPKFEKNLQSYIISMCKQNSSYVHKIGGMEDHVHILLEPSRNISVVKLLQSIKANSSRWMKTQPGCSDFSWQRGYGIFSVGPSNVESVKRYIANQKEHHKKFSFKEEFEKLLRRANIDFDERYLWD